MSGEGILWLFSSPVEEKPPRHEEKKATVTVVKKDAKDILAPAVLNPSPLHVVPLDNPGQSVSASAAVVKTSVPLEQLRPSTSASASSTAIPTPSSSAIATGVVSPISLPAVQVQYLSTISELDQIAELLDETNQKEEEEEEEEEETEPSVSVAANSSAISSESSASLATLSSASSSDRASGSSREISAKEINRARVAQVTTMLLDADNQKWKAICFSRAMEAIRGGDAEVLQDNMGPLVLHEQSQIDFLNDYYTYPRMDIVVKTATRDWLGHVKTRLMELKDNQDNQRYTVDDFNSDILGRERGISVSALIGKIKSEVEGRLSSIERNRKNQGALFLPPDMQARYVKYLVASYQDELIAAHAELRAWLIRKNILDQTFTRNELFDIDKILKAEFDKRDKEVTDADKKIKNYKTNLEANQNKKKNKLKYAIDPSAIASVTEVSSVSASVSASSSVNASSSCESTEEDADEESKVESEVTTQKENSEKVKDSKEEKKGSQAELKEDTKAVPDSFLERLRQGEVEIKDFNVFRDDHGRTLMHYAITYFVREPTQNRLKIIEMLLQAGISPFVRDKNGEDAFEYADFDTRLQEQVIDRETSNPIALLYWKVLSFTGKYMAPLYSDYSQGALDKINNYTKYAIKNLGSSAHWWTHDWGTSNITRPRQVLEALRAVHNGDINLSDPLLEQEASVVVNGANVSNGFLCSSILGSTLGERLDRPKRLQVSVEDVSRSDEGATRLFYNDIYEKSEKARKEAEEKSRREEQARKEAEEKSRREEQARKEAEEKSRREEQARKEAEEREKKKKEEVEKLQERIRVLELQFQPQSQSKTQEPTVVAVSMLAPQALTTSVGSSNSAVVAPLPILVAANSNSVVSANSVPSVLSASLAMATAASNSLVSGSSVTSFKS